MLDPLVQAAQNLTFIPLGDSKEPITLFDDITGDIRLESYQLDDLNDDGLEDAAFVIVKENDYEESLPEVGVALGIRDGSFDNVDNKFLYKDALFLLDTVDFQVVLSVEEDSIDIPSTTYYVINEGRFVKPTRVIESFEAKELYSDYLVTKWNAGQDEPTDSILTRDTLSNMVYQLEYTQKEDGRVPLQSGMYSESPRTEVRLLPTYAYGDLTGDGISEAVVTIGSNTGGPGGNTDLVVVGVLDGEPQQITSRFLGDKVQITLLEIKQNTLHLGVDGATQLFQLRNGTLEEVKDQ